MNMYIYIYLCCYCSLLCLTRRPRRLLFFLRWRGAKWGRKARPVIIFLLNWKRERDGRERAHLWECAAPSYQCGTLRELTNSPPPLRKWLWQEALYKHGAFCMIKRINLSVEGGWNRMHRMTRAAESTETFISTLLQDETGTAIRANWCCLYWIRTGTAGHICLSVTLCGVQQQCWEYPRPKCFAVCCCSRSSNWNSLCSAHILLTASSRRRLVVIGLERCRRRRISTLPGKTTRSRSGSTSWKCFRGTWNCGATSWSEFGQIIYKYIFHQDRPRRKRVFISRDQRCWSGFPISKQSRIIITSRLRSWSTSDPVPPPPPPPPIRTKDSHSSFGMRVKKNQEKNIGRDRTQISSLSDQKFHRVVPPSDLGLERKRWQLGNGRRWETTRISHHLHQRMDHQSTKNFFFV